jgi:hypothetical protein
VRGAVEKMLHQYVIYCIFNHVFKSKIPRGLGSFYHSLSITGTGLWKN